MLYIYKKGKFKQQKHNSYSELFSDLTKQHPEKNWRMSDIDKFDKRLSKGDNIYCWIQPEIPEYSNGDIIYWHTSPKEAEDALNLWCEEI